MQLSRILLCFAKYGMKKLFTNTATLRCLNETVSLQQHKLKSHHTQLAKWPLLQDI